MALEIPRALENRNYLILWVYSYDSLNITTFGIAVYDKKTFVNEKYNPYNCEVAIAIAIII